VESVADVQQDLPTATTAAAAAAGDAFHGRVFGKRRKDSYLARGCSTGWDRPASTRG
jgi:hypothetical protein